MRVVVFDTETTGLPVHRNIPAKNHPNNWPHIVSISWMVLDNDVLTKRKSYIVKPMNWTIPEESIKIHGITQERATAQGTDLEYVINEFISEHYDMLIAHNLEFDENVLVNAIYWDLGRREFIAFPEHKRCTMAITRDICKLPSKNPKYFKSPKLSELYEYTFGTTPIIQNLHNSMYDVELLVKIIQHSRPIREKLGLVKPSIIHNNVRSKVSTTLSL